MFENAADTPSRHAGGSVLALYEAFAPIYNDFNHLNDYEMWVGRVLLPELEKHGLKHGHVLDVGCGTGRAFGPLLRRGWQVYGCDLSPAMLQVAARDSAGCVRLSVADMRELPLLGEFDLIISLNDPVNHLLGDDDLKPAFCAFHRNLAADGLLLFDCTSKTTFDTLFSTDVWKAEKDGRTWTWQGLGEVGQGSSIFEARIEGDDIEPFKNRERYRSQKEICEAMHSAGLECLAILGMEEATDTDERKVVLRDLREAGCYYKIVYIGRRLRNDVPPGHRS